MSMDQGSYLVQAWPLVAPGATHRTVPQLYHGLHVWVTPREGV